LRGAGNILGSEQSGFVHAIGLDTYTRLLEQTIKRLREGDVPEAAPCEVSVEGGAWLPDDYVPDAAQKLHVYRRLSRVETVEQVEVLATEIRDRYGTPPAEAARLFHAAALRLAGSNAGVERILIRGESARVSFRAGVAPRLASLQDALADRQTDVDVARANPLSLRLRARGAAAIVDTLLIALAHLAQPRARAA
jgi:transcription-repair coupling factor (superfamily II helicase)